jgi:hypothetical protein
MEDPRGITSPRFVVLMAFSRVPGERDIATREVEDETSLSWNCPGASKRRLTPFVHKTI